MKWTFKWNKTKFTITAIAGCLLLALLLAPVWIAPLVSHELKTRINDNPKIPYHLEFDRLYLNIFNGTAGLTAVSIRPKEEIRDRQISLKAADLDEIELGGIPYLSLLFGGSIQVERLSVSAAKISLVQNHSPASSPREASEKPFAKIVEIATLEFKNTQISLANESSEQNQLEVSNLNLEINGLRLDSLSLKNKVPFEFKNYNIRCDSMNYRALPFYRLSSSTVVLTDSEGSVKDLELKPLLSKAAFQKHIDKERDLFKLTNSTLQLKGLKWNWDGQGFSVTAAKLELDSLNAEVYRNKQVVDDRSTKPMFSQKLRELPFYLEIDSLQISRSRLEYIEQIDFNTEASHIVFGQFNARGTHLRSGLAAKNRKEPTQLNVQALFMEQAPLSVEWNFDVNSLQDRFHFSGQILRLSSAKLNTFLRPQINAEMKGTLDQVNFNIQGNNQSAQGTFAVKYRDFELEFLRKNAREKNQFLSAIARIFVKKDSGEQLRKAQIEKQRNPEKSFFNYMWISLADGLKKTFLKTGKTS